MPAIRELAGPPRLGGGAANAALAAVQAIRRLGLEHIFRVRLINAGSSAPSVATHFARHGIEFQSLGRISMPHSLIIPLENDRLIISEPWSLPCASLDLAQHTAVTQTVAHALAVASSSSKDPELASAVFGNCNGAHRYAGVTGSLGPEHSMIQLARAHNLLVNFDELDRLRVWAGLGSCGMTEVDPDAAYATIQTLRDLREKNHAGTDCAVVTLGRRGSVAAEWQAGQIHAIGIQTTEDMKGVPTPAGTGDSFLGNFVALQEAWAPNGLLRDPFLGCVVRATYVVADSIGLKRDRYQLQVRTMAA